MKISHYITIDNGSGPVSFVDVERDDGQTTMLRVTHNARFDRIKEVDATTTRQAVDASTDLGSATTRVDPENAYKLSQEVLRWASQHGCTDQAMRWPEGGPAVGFRNEVEATAWDDSNYIAPVTKRRKMILG